MKKMKLLINTVIILLFSVFAFAQKPNTFPLETNPNNSNFELYSQKGGIQKRTTFDFARNYFAPKINSTILSVAPSPTGNINNINQFVYWDNGLKKSFIDHYGTRFDLGGTSQSVNVGNSNIVSNGNYTFDIGLNTWSVIKGAESLRFGVSLYPYTTGFYGTNSTDRFSGLLYNGAAMYSDDKLGKRSEVWVNPHQISLKAGLSNQTQTSGIDIFGSAGSAHGGQSASGIRLKPYSQNGLDVTSKWLKSVNSYGDVEWTDLPTATSQNIANSNLVANGNYTLNGNSHHYDLFGYESFLMHAKSLAFTSNYYTEIYSDTTVSVRSGSDDLRLDNGADNTGKYLRILNPNGKLGFVDLPSGGITNLVGGQGIEITGSNIVNLGAAAAPPFSNLDTKRYFSCTAGGGLVFKKLGNIFSEPLSFEGQDDGNGENTALAFRLSDQNGLNSITHSIEASNGGGLSIKSAKNLLLNAVQNLQIFGQSQITLSTPNGYGIIANSNASSTALNRMRVGRYNNTGTSPYIQFGDNIMSFANLPSPTAGNTHVLTSDSNGGTVAVKSISSIMPAPATFSMTSSGNVMTATHNSAIFDVPIINSNALQFTAPNSLKSVVNGQQSNTVQIVNSVSNAVTAGSLVTTVNGVASAPLTLPTVVLGDTKHGYQATDHNGWVRLDGRLITTLTTTQQAAAISLGITLNLPNTQDKFVKSSIGSANTGIISGSNTSQFSLNGSNIPLLIGILPNYSLSVPAYTNVNGGGSKISQGGNSVSGTASYEGITATPITPTISLGNNFPQPINIVIDPINIALNHFIYLGN